MTKNKTLSFLASLMLLGGLELCIVSEANAIIGRPLTPMSYAGVARRTTRRAVVAGAAVGAAATPYPYYW
jgi:hypothetical protein